VKTNGTKYSPALKFQVVLEALKAEGKGTQAQVCRVSLVALPASNECYTSRLSHYSSPITHQDSIRRHSSLDYQSPMEYLISEGFIPEKLVGSGVKSGSAPRAQAPLTGNGVEADSVSEAQDYQRWFRLRGPGFIMKWEEVIG